MSNKDFLEKRLAEYETKAEQARTDGNYPEFQKWEFEANNIKTLIKMGDEVTE